MNIKIILHFTVTFLVAQLIYTFLPDIIGSDPYWGPIIPALIAFTFACMVGIGKELWDKYHDNESIDAGDLTIDFTAAIVWLFLPKVAELMPWM
jgi:predicted membrane chloride channel (bestrophin family)